MRLADTMSPSPAPAEEHHYLALTAALLDLTRTMLRAVDGEEWGKVQENERHRQALLGQLSVSRPGGGPWMKAAAENLEELCRLNERLTARAEQARRELHGKISLVQRGRRANLAYYR